MGDSRFFTNAGAITLEQIAAHTGATIFPSSVSPSLAFSDVAPLDRAGKTDISFLDNTKYLDAFAHSKAGACFVRQKFAERAPKDMVLLITEEPYYAFALAAQKFYPTEPFEPMVSPAADVAKTATLGKNIRIDSGAVIGDRAVIGDGVWIGPNSVIGKCVEIGAGSRIGALCCVTHAIIGTRAIIHRGVQIGQDGFGFAAGKKGITKMPQLGRVIIGNDVEVGANSCIDRGAGPDTAIGDFSKIDNLVQIGHNVQVGRFTMISAQTGISGSTVIGDGVLVGGQVGFAGHISVGNGAKFAAKSGVMHDVPAGATYGGGPAIPIREWHRQTATLTKISRNAGAIKLKDEL